MRLAGATVSSLRMRGVLALAALALLLLACRAETGTYAPVDITTELHYSQSARSQEPPRFEGAPGAVPFVSLSEDASEATLTPAAYRAWEYDLTLETSVDLANPTSATDANVAMGADLFRTNCAFCHGTAGRGDGPVNEYLQAYFSIPAPDLMGQGGPTTMSASPTLGKSDGELFLLISQGGFTNTTLGMPEFRLLLTPMERWLLVTYIRHLGDQ